MTTKITAQAKKRPARLKQLTPKERLFVARYCHHWNASRAIREAGYETDYPAEMGYALLRKVHIQHHVAKGREENERRREDLDNQASAFLAEQMGADPRRLLDENGKPKAMKDIGDEEASLIAGFEFESEVINGSVNVRVSKFRLESRRAAAESIHKVNAEYKRRADRKLGPINGEVLPPAMDTQDDDMVKLARRVAFALALGAQAKAKQIDKK